MTTSTPDWGLGSYEHTAAQRQPAAEDAVDRAKPLEPASRLAPPRERLETILEEANEDPEAFRVTSRYIVAVATRGEAAGWDAAATDTGR